jgi:pimeloyl-ACP methyl ester carboxylesterase
MFDSLERDKQMDAVTSKDGTTITYDRLGDGPAVILVCGGSVDRMSHAPLADLLAKNFTVYNYDRRGRNASGDTQPYAVEREVEDIDALVDAAGGSAYLFGSSSGAALALEAARQLPGRITKLALWEPPYIPDGFRRPPADTAKTFSDLVAQGRRGDAAEHFMVQVVGLPQEMADQMRTSPFWASQEALAHTLAYDATIMGDYILPVDRVAEVKIPTLVLDGGASFPFMHPTAQAIAAHLPNGQQRTLEGQRHDFAADAMAPVLTAFFQS